MSFFDFIEEVGDAMVDFVGEVGDATIDFVEDMGSLACDILDDLIGCNSERELQIVEQQIEEMANEDKSKLKLYYKKHRNEMSEEVMRKFQERI